MFNIKQIFTEQRRAGEKRKMSIAQARPLISAQEADSMLNQDEVRFLHPVCDLVGVSSQQVQSCCWKACQCNTVPAAAV